MKEEKDGQKIENEGGIYEKSRNPLTCLGSKYLLPSLSAESRYELIRQVWYDYFYGTHGEESV